MTKDELIPKINSMDAKNKHNGDKKWNCFARKAQKNPFMKNYILKLFKGICPWCGKRIRKFVLHHIDYDHVCEFPNLIEYPNPTEKRPHRKVKVPDCHKCFNENNETFLECAKKLVPVHPICNIIISKAACKKP